MGLPRTVTPEILDTLDAGHPDALRSRRDLRRLDGFLGGSRWISRAVLDHKRESDAGVIELGAGDGRLCGLLAAGIEGVTGLDLGERPAGLNPRVHWRTGDFIHTLPGMKAGIVVGSLILHHFSDASLRVLGEMFQAFRVLVFSEPLRSRWALGLSSLARPFVGRVTAHDMPASIRAGFQAGELASLLGLDPESWCVEESGTLAGVLRFKAWRR